MPPLDVRRPDSQLNHLSWRETDDRTVVLPGITIPPVNLADLPSTIKLMTYFAGGSFEMGSKRFDYQSLPHKRQVAPFYLDPIEGTWRAYIKQQPEAKSPPEIPGEDYPVTRISHDLAVAHAERVGKRLPDEAEYEFAATNGGTQEYPWGNDASS